MEEDSTREPSYSHQVGSHTGRAIRRRDADEIDYRQDGRAVLVIPSDQERAFYHLDLDTRSMVRVSTGARPSVAWVGDAIALGKEDDVVSLNQLRGYELVAAWSTLVPDSRHATIARAMSPNVGSLSRAVAG